MEDAEDSKIADRDGKLNDDPAVGGIKATTTHRSPALKESFGDKMYFDEP